MAAGNHTVSAVEENIYRKSWMTEETLTVLIAEPIFCPDATNARDSMDCIYEAIAARLVSHRTLDVLVAQQARRHTGPEGEHDKCQQVTHGQSSPARLVQRWSCW